MLKYNFFLNLRIDCLCLERDLIIFKTNSLYIHNLFIAFFYFLSRDCPIFYMRKKVQKDLSDQDKLIQRFGDFTWWLCLQWLHETPNLLSKGGMSAELCYYVFRCQLRQLGNTEWNILHFKHSLNCWHQTHLFKLKVPLQSSYPPKVLTILTLTLLEKGSQYSHLQPPSVRQNWSIHLQTG